MTTKEHVQIDNVDKKVDLITIKVEAMFTIIDILKDRYTTTCVEINSNKKDIAWLKWLTAIMATALISGMVKLIFFSH
jgi:hypothetical protein